MEKKSNGVGVAVAGCLLLLIVIVGAGGWFVTGRAMDGELVPGTAQMLGYTLSGGPVGVGQDGLKRATIHVAVAEGYSLERFDVSDTEWRVDLQSHPARQVTGAPPLPTEVGFDLVYEFPDVPVESESAVVRLRLKINAKASKGLFGLVSTQSDSSHLLRVHADRLELSTP